MITSKGVWDHDFLYMSRLRFRSHRASSHLYQKVKLLLSVSITLLIDMILYIDLNPCILDADLLSCCTTLVASFTFTLTLTSSRSAMVIDGSKGRREAPMKSSEHIWMHLDRSDRFEHIWKLLTTCENLQKTSKKSLPTLKKYDRWRRLSVDATN